MTDLLRNPIWRPETLGRPLPNDPHAVSVSMPLWEHVIGYEENDPAVVNKLQCGYPRFFIHPLVMRMFRSAESELGKEGERVMVLPSRAAAERCSAYVKRLAGADGRVEAWKGGMVGVAMPAEAFEAAAKYWRFCGEIVSSRRAEAELEGREGLPEEGELAKRAIRKRLADLSGQAAEDVYLFSSGIAAVFAAHRIVSKLRPGRKTAQLEFPYVDVLKVQEQFGEGVEFVPNPAGSGVEEVRAQMIGGNLAGVFCEIPSNPLLRTADLPALASVLQPEGIPLVVDDTIATLFNVDALAFADLVTGSLTKYFSGVGDVLAGSLILKRESDLYAELKRSLEEDFTDDLWNEDAVVLERNSRDFSDRMPRVNENAEAVFEFLESHRLVEKVWYPKNQTPAEYEEIQREDGGYGGLMSVLLKDAEIRAPRFFDVLEMCKGPSLGTNFTLACPYMFLAHYPELDWAEEIGIDRHLVRFSIGLEEPEDLIERLKRAFSQV